MRRDRGFALYEVLLGMLIFIIGVFALGRAVENCLNASALSEEENRVRQVLSNRMAEIEADPALPDAKKVMDVDTGYGTVKLIQQTVPQQLQDRDNTLIDGISRVTLQAVWTRDGTKQNRQLVFYVYRLG